MLIDLQLSTNTITDIALCDIDSILRSNGRSVSDFPPMPIPSSSAFSVVAPNILMAEETNYDIIALLEKHNILSGTLTDEQASICYSGDGGIFFADGFGSTEKTFVWNTLTTAIHSKGQIVLARNHFLEGSISWCKLTICR